MNILCNSKYAKNKSIYTNFNYNTRQNDSRHNLFEKKGGPVILWLKIHPQATEQLRIYTFPVFIMLKPKK